MKKRLSEVHILKGFFLDPNHLNLHVSITNILKEIYIFHYILYGTDFIVV